MTQRRPGATSMLATRAQASAAPGTVIHPHLRRALKVFRWLFNFVVVGVILTIPIVVLLQHGTANFLPNLISQIAALWTLIVANPLLATLAALALLDLFVLSLRADAQTEALARAAATQAAAAAGAGAARQEVAEQAPKMAQQIAETVSPPVEEAAAGGAYFGAGVAIGAATPRMAEAVATEVVGQLRENIEIAVEAGQRARLAAPPLPAGVVTTSGLPRPRELFGREPKLEELLAALTAGGAVNVCAVEGLPGIGKTALAAETVALAVERRLFSSALWLSCEGRRGADGLATIWADLAKLLGEQDIAQMSDANLQRADLHTTLANPDRAPLLIALDNVEPDLPASYADALAQTLTGPRTSLLLTARQALESSLVRAFPLDTLTEAAAQDLFRAQLQLRAPERPTPDEAQALPAIIAELDGLALALQLTADYASVQRRPLPALLDQLRREGVAGGPLAKLKASVDRSWAILTPTQRPLFAGLALLDGSSFPRAAALAAANAAAELAAADATTAAPEAETGGDALDALVGLSLVEPLTNDRMRLHPLLREYAADRFRGDFALQKQHCVSLAVATYYAEYVRSASPSALDVDRANVNAAIEWAYAQGEWSLVVDLCVPMVNLWRDRWLTRDSRRLLPLGIAAATALANQDDTPQSRRILSDLRLAHARALHRTEEHIEAKKAFEADLVYRQAIVDREGEANVRQLLGEGYRILGDLDEAEAQYQQSLQIWRDLPDRKRFEGVVLGYLGRIAYARANYAEADRYFADSLKIAKDQRDQMGIGRVLNSLGQVALARGDMRGAESRFAEAISILRAVDDRPGVSDVLTNMGRLAIDRNDLARADELFRESLMIDRDIMDLQGEATGLSLLAQVALERGDLSEAEQQFVENLKRRMQVHDLRGEGVDRSFLGRIALEQGDLPEARAHYEQALEIAVKVGNKRGEVASVNQLGVVAVLSDDAVTAKRYLDWSMRMAQELHSKPDIARATLSQGEFAIRIERDVKKGQRLIKEAIRMYKDMQHPLDLQRAEALAQTLGSTD